MSLTMSFGLFVYLSNLGVLYLIMSLTNIREYSDNINVEIKKVNYWKINCLRLLNLITN
jgi:hypothetical protein